MATYHAIAATSEAIRTFLENACPRNEFGPSFQFLLYQAKDFQQSMDEGVSLYLYRVTPTPVRRNIPPRMGRDGKKYRPPIPIDLHYLLTAWAKTTIMQQSLMGWCIRTLEDLPILNSALLNQQLPQPDVFRPDEAVEFVHDPIALQDLTNILENLKPNCQVSSSYIARMILLESQIPLPESPLVQAREFDTGILQRVGGGTL